MIPDNALSSIMVPSELSGARSGSITPTIDLEDGGVDLNDPSLGLLYQDWTTKKVNDTVITYSETTNPVQVLSAYGVTEISMTFDQNMRPIIAYVQLGRAKMQWYDTQVSGVVTTDFGTGILNPRVSLDDKRYLADSSSDIILGYLRNDNLYFRQQRDRFTIEYLLASDVYSLTNGRPSKELTKIGMGRNNRFQFVLGTRN